MESLGLPGLLIDGRVAKSGQSLGSMMSCILAIDAADEANGCLHVLRGSHLLGRLEHGSSGDQAGADPEMVEKARGRFETVACTLAPGDVLFTHSNLVHWSRANESDRWRRAMIFAYSAVGNGPTPGPKSDGVIPQPHPLVEVDDGALLRIGPVGFQANSAPAAVFLDQERNKSTFKQGKDFSAEAEALAAVARAEL